MSGPWRISTSSSTRCHFGKPPASPRNLAPGGALNGKGQIGRHPHDPLTLLGLACPARGRVVLSVMGKVAPLATGLEVGIIAILRLVVEVRGGEDDNGFGDGMRQAVPGLTPHAINLKLTPATGALKSDPETDRFPVCRISPALLFTDRHGFCSLANVQTAPKGYC